MQARLFDVGPDPDPAPPRPQHYGRLLAVCALSYGRLDQPGRIRCAKLAARLRGNGIPERRITEEGARLRVALGRAPTLGEVADRILG